MNRKKLIDIFNQHSPNTPMSEDETMAYMNMLMSKDPIFDVDLNEADKEDPNYKHFKPLIDSFVPQVFLGRLKAMTSLKMSLGALIILIHHMESPGNAVMHTFYLHYKLPDYTLITLDVISRQLFPFGMFSEEQLNEIWNAQKVSGDDRPKGGTDNMIDYPEVWRD